LRLVDTIQINARPEKPSMKAVKSNPDPEWGAVATSDKFLSGV
jgi:hypothetical protein